MEHAKRSSGVREAGRVVKILCHANQRRVIVFGSVAGGTARPQGDIDICVLFDTFGSRPAFGIKQDLYQLLWGEHYDFPVGVDVHVYDAARDAVARAHHVVDLVQTAISQFLAGGGTTDAD